MSKTFEQGREEVARLCKYFADNRLDFFAAGVNINADPGPAYQLRRYGWSAKVPLSILTDFEELGVYDCSLRPRPADKASFGRIQYYRFEEYPDRWREYMIYLHLGKSSFLVIYEIIVIIKRKESQQNQR